MPREADSAFENSNKPLISDFARLESAASQGDALAQTELAWCYYIGNGVKRNRDEAITWYRRAAEQGLEEAQEMLRRLNVDTAVQQTLGRDTLNDTPKLAAKSSRLLVALTVLLAVLVICLGTGAYIVFKAGLLPSTADNDALMPTEGTSKESYLIADLDRDKNVDFADLSLFLDSWLQNSPLEMERGHEDVNGQHQNTE